MVTDPSSPGLISAWLGFHAAQTEVLGWMTSEPRFQDEPQHRAKAYHTMMEALAMAYNFAVAPRMLHPRIQVTTGWFSDYYTLGQNGPDLHYALFFLDGTQTYRLRGNYGDCKLILFQLINHLSGHPDSKLIGDHDLAEFVTPDGSFDIILSADEQDGHWIKLERNCDRHFVLMRRFMAAPSDRPASLKLDRVSDIPDTHYDAEEFDESVMARRIEAATHFLRYLIRDFNLNLFKSYVGVGGGFNNMAFLPGTITSQVGSSFSNYAMTGFDLAEDEALIITLDPLPDGVYWSFQLGNVWSRSLNYMYRQTSLNRAQVEMDSDGACRVVVAHRDPGIANWLDTMGHVQGTVVFRNYRASGQPVPQTVKVKLVDVAMHLPADTKRVSLAERDAYLKGRHQAYLALQGE